MNECIYYYEEPKETPYCIKMQKYLDYGCEVDCRHCMKLADVVEVVRCKDCKYYHKQISASIFWPPYDWKCSIHFDSVGDFKPSDYCSYGERKEQEHE